MPACSVVTSQVPVEHWHDVIGDLTLGDAILDRLVHNAHRLQLSGESMRKQNARNQTLDANTNP
jgi:DNA replication protein DnaC